MAKQRARLTDDNDPLNSTESVFTSLEQASKSESQQVDNIAIQKVEKSKPKQQPIKLTQQLDDLPTSQQVNKSKIRKSTFQLSEAVLTQLDRYHLQLQLDLGKADAPYKEIIVEEAIAQFLANADSKSVNSLLERQKTR